MNNYEKFHKDKIDWKFFNYLKDKLIEFQDMGYKFTLCIYAKCKGSNNITSIYAYYDEDNEEFNVSSLDNVEMKNNIYRYFITHRKENWYDTSDTMDKLWEKISKKCIKKYYTGVTLEVEPKQNI